MDINFSDNYWSMYVLKNTSCLFNTKLISSSSSTLNKNKFSVYYVRTVDSKITTTTNVAETIKLFLQSLFDLVNTDKNTNFKDCLTNATSFDKADFDTHVIDLKVNKSSDSGLTIAGAVQELFDYISVENDNLDDIKFNKVASEDFRLNLRDIIYNKMSDFYTQVKKEQKRMKLFSLEGERKNSLNNLNTKSKLNFASVLRIQQEKIQSHVSMKIFSRDSRRVMNEVLNDFYKSNGSNNYKLNDNYRLTNYTNKTIDIYNENENKKDKNNLKTEIDNKTILDEKPTENDNIYKRKRNQSKNMSQSPKKETVDNNLKEENSMLKENKKKNLENEFDQKLKCHAVNSIETETTLLNREHCTQADHLLNEPPSSAAVYKRVLKFSQLKIQQVYETQIIKEELKEEELKEEVSRQVCCTTDKCIIC